MPAFEPGWVWLAGAGPGDPGLVTVLGLHAIAEADVILYDALVNEALLEARAAQCRTDLCRQARAARSRCKQSDISRTLVSLARKGQRVLRLKGGDPFVFGRGGEEALTLARAGVPFRIVPGVTAGIGGLAYAGIPVTHRDTNHAVTFVTGHGSRRKIARRSIGHAVAKGSPTLVFYMALAHADAIARQLIDAGRDAQRTRGDRQRCDVRRAICARDDARRAWGQKRKNGRRTGHHRRRRERASARRARLAGRVERERVLVPDPLVRTKLKDAS